MKHLKEEKNFCVWDLQTASRILNWTISSLKRKTSQNEKRKEQNFVVNKANTKRYKRSATHAKSTESRKW